VVSFGSHIKFEPRPDWSLLGVYFKFSDEHPRYFLKEAPPGVRDSTNRTGHYFKQEIDRKQ